MLAYDPNDAMRHRCPARHRDRRVRHSDPVESRTTPPTSPEPLTTVELRFVEMLAEIAPPLAEHPERAARRGANSCGSRPR